MTNAKSNSGADDAAPAPRSQREFDLAFQDIAAQLPDLSHPTVAGGGPRDWSPTPPDDAAESFDPAQLPPPPATPVSAATLLTLGAAAILLGLVALSWVGVLSLPTALIISGGIGGFGALGAGIWLSSPREKPYDDDGARL
ncbi:MAG: hypothetical protein Q4E03_03885 [Trueperella sp.]|nr:hypothetical protein [Trueperella sp.]